MYMARREVIVKLKYVIGLKIVIYRHRETGRGTRRERIYRKMMHYPRNPFASALEDPVILHFDKDLNFPSSN